MFRKVRPESAENDPTGQDFRQVHRQERRLSQGINSSCVKVSIGTPDKSSRNVWAKSEAVA